MRNKKGGMGGKRGFELAINTLVIIVLAVMVLAALTISFTIGWQKFWNTTKGYFGSEIDSIAKMCENSCNLDNRQDYCCLERSADFGNGIEKINCKDERLWADRGIFVECKISCEGVC